MKTQRITLAAFLLLISIGCSKDSTHNPMPPDKETMYFPPIGSNNWESVSPQELGWNAAAEQPLYTFLEENNTDAFILLKNGRIVLETYFGNFTAAQNHTWNSAAKTLTAFTVGIAQEEGYLSIDNPSSDYMGTGWSSLTPEQEQRITVKNHLTMTTGLDYTIDNTTCTDPDCLLYKNEPGSYWYYDTGAYTLLDSIISGAVNEDYQTFFNSRLGDKIGMQGSYKNVGYLNLYASTARSMARFGLLNLNKGRWDGTPIMTDLAYFTAMTTTSQGLNKAYGYLWWLNGKDSYRIPGSEKLFSGKLIPSAPDDLIAGLGANDQKLYVVPSKGLVIIRLGDSANEKALGPTAFDDGLWKKINALID